MLVDLIKVRRSSKVVFVTKSCYPPNVNREYCQIAVQLAAFVFLSLFRALVMVMPWLGLSLVCDFQASRGVVQMPIRIHQSMRS